MKTSRWAAAAAAALPLALGACGATDSSTLQSAAPDYSSLSMDMTSADTTDAQSTPATTADAVDLAVGAVAADVCHPHLFVRTHDVALRVNRHLWKFLRHVAFLTERKADKLAGGQATWQRQNGPVEARWTVTEVSDKVYDFKLELAPASTTAWTTVFSGEVDRTGATAAHQGKGSATLDLTALHQVLPSEPASGKLSIAFEAFASYRKSVFDAVDVVWDAAGDADAAALGSTPRNAHYVYYREPGKGGSLKGHDEMVFLCPQTVPANKLPADVKVLTRWYRDADGSVKGRSDALMVGGQLPAADEVQGVVCHDAAAEGLAQVESYWMMKEVVSATDATAQSWGPRGDVSTCGALFGPVPAVDSGASDFDFGSLSFDSNDPAPFPGM